MRPEAMKQDAEEFFRDFQRNFQEQKAKQAKTSAKPKYENPNPFTEGDGDVLVAVENSEGMWEVPGC